MRLPNRQLNPTALLRGKLPARVRDVPARLRDVPTALRDSPPSLLWTPDRDDPAPRSGRLAGVCAWAAALGLLGLPVAATAGVAVVTGLASGWFGPTVAVLGLVGIALTVAALSVIRQSRLPWLLLGAATAVLVATLVLTATR